VFAPTALYIVHLLKVHYHSVSFINKMYGLFLHCFVQKLGRFLLLACIFCHGENLFSLFTCVFVCLLMSLIGLAVSLRVLHNSASFCLVVCGVT